MVAPRGRAALWEQTAESAEGRIMMIIMLTILMIIVARVIIMAIIMNSDNS